jgi:hypothetical protein
MTNVSPRPRLRSTSWTWYLSAPGGGPSTGGATDPALLISNDLEHLVFDGAGIAPRLGGTLLKLVFARREGSHWPTIDFVDRGGGALSATELDAPALRSEPGISA